MFNFLTYRRAKANNGWVGRTYRRRKTIVVYREGLLEGKYPVDEWVLTYPTSRPRRDLKRIHAGVRADVVELEYGALPLTPRPDIELSSPQEQKENDYRRSSFWVTVRQQEEEIHAKRLRGNR